MNRVERTDIDCERSFRAADHEAIDRSEVEHVQQIGEFFALDRRLSVVEIAEEALTIHGAERLDRDQVGGRDAITGSKSDSCPVSVNRRHSRALASTYFIRVLAHGAKRCLNVHPTIQLRDLQVSPILRSQPEATLARQTLPP